MFGVLRVGFDVLLLSSVKEPKPTADGMDDLLSTALVGLRPYDVKRVSRPAEITISGSKYLGAVITIEHDTKEP